MGDPIVDGSPVLILFTPRRNKIFRLHTKCICNAVDVIEIADDLSCIMDGSVIKPMFAEFI